jgi:hypothetical protein
MIDVKNVRHMAFIHPHHMRWSHRFRLLVVAVSAACTGLEDRNAAGSRTGDGAAGNGGERRFTEVQWDTLFTLRGATPGAPFVRPRLLAARGSRLYVYDYGTRQVAAFDSTGRTMWVTSSERGTPYDFGNVTDLQIAPNGDVWAVDGAKRQISILAPSGSFVRPVPVGDEVRRVVPPASDSAPFAAVVSRAPGAWTVYSRTGARLAQARFSDPVLVKAAPWSRQSFIAVGPDGGMWGAIYPFGDRFTVYRDTVQVCTGRYVDGGSFVPPAAGVRRAARAVAVGLRDTSVFILAGRKEPSGLSMLDHYSARSCRYYRSFHLPGRYLTMAVDGDRFYFESETPTAGQRSTPTVVALRQR